jgi:uncharacterized membrane protein YdjX (TVP38/TMEM64 family)
MKIKTSESFLKDILSVLVVTLLFAATSYVLSLDSVRQQIFDISKWQTYLKDYEWYGSLIFISGLVLANTLGMPRTWICVISGAIYSAAFGVCLAQFITLFGATLNFYAGRLCLYSPIKRRIPDQLKIWYDRCSEHGFYWVLNIRLFPFGNATVVSVLAGASRMRYRDFIAATLLGYLPLTVIFALFGSSVSQKKLSHLIVGGGLFLIFFGGKWMYKKTPPYRNRTLRA